MLIKECYCFYFFRISGLLTNSQQCAELAKLFVVGFKKLRSQAQVTEAKKVLFSFSLLSCSHACGSRYMEVTVVFFIAVAKELISDPSLLFCFRIPTSKSWQLSSTWLRLQTIQTNCWGMTANLHIRINTTYFVLG